MTGDELSSIAGVLLSLIFSYVPGVSAWYEKLTGEYKRLVMAVVLAVVSGALYGMGCAGWLGDMVALTCDYAGARVLIRGFIAALVANQATYLISPKS